jgi:hypothetical protein
MGAQAPEGLLGIHLNFLRQAVGSVIGLPADSEAERAALAALSTFRTSGSGYFMDQATRPQTIGYALLDSQKKSARCSVAAPDDSPPGQ